MNRKKTVLLLLTAISFFTSSIFAETWYICLGSFKGLDNAKQRVNALASCDIKTFISEFKKSETETYYRVFYDQTYESWSQANAKQIELEADSKTKRLGIKGSWCANVPDMEKFNDETIPQSQPNTNTIIIRETIKEVPVEKRIEVIKEVPVEKTVEVIREVPVEVIKEVPVETIIEVIKEVPVEKTIEVIREVQVEVIKEVPVDKIVEVIKEVPVEVIKEVPVEKIIEVIKEVPVEVIKEVPVEVIKEVPVQVAKEVPEDSGDENSAEDSDKVNPSVDDGGHTEEKETEESPGNDDTEKSE